MTGRRSSPFPVGFEEKLILEKVRNDDRVVYLDSCACLPLYQQLARVIGERNIRTAAGPHESIRVADEWATIIIGQCVLDEFRNVSKALSEISRVLADKGRAVLSGPVSRNRSLELESQDNPPRPFISLNDLKTRFTENGLSFLQSHDLTGEIRSEFARSGRESSVLDFESSMDYVLVEAIKDSTILRE